MLINSLINNCKNIKTKLIRKSKKLLSAISLLGITTLILTNYTQFWAAAASTTEEHAVYSNNLGPANGLLIFLDDSENAKGSESFTIGSALLATILQEAGLIVTSGALLAGLKEFSAPREQDPVKLKALYDSLTADTPENNLTRKNILLSMANLNSLFINNWVIKQVNSELYLLIPNHYLTTKNIKKFSPEPDNLTRQFLLREGNAELAELALGLRVNHMPTVAFAELREPTTAPQFANYFIAALRENQLFVTNHDYYLASQAASASSRTSDNFPKIPAWSFYLAGHGLSNYSIAHLSPTQFKEFLELFDNKINTKLLYYMSCYAAGTNSELVYKDLTTGINKTYDFAIITQALTDTTTSYPALKLVIERGILKIESKIAYNNFFAQITTNKTNNIDSASKPDYQKITEILSPNLIYSTSSNLNNTPQIKFPGIPWFSVLKNDTVVSIGSILAKTRTTSLNIATFFTQKNPLAILLYTPNIPFELLINTRTPTGDVPAIISMLPGDAMHHLKQISSQIYPTEQLLNSFLQLDGLKPQKIFLIDQVSYTPKTAAPYIITDAVIVLRDSANLIYFKYLGDLYKSTGKISATNPVKHATATEKTDYDRFLAQYSTAEITMLTPALMRDIQTAANLRFSRKSTVTEAIQNITDTLNSMPNNSILYINKIDGAPYSAEHSTPWLDLITSAAQYKAPAMPTGTRKILWIDRIDAGRKTPEGRDILEYTDLIIDCSAQETKVYFKTNRARPQKLTAGNYSTASSYIPLFEELLVHFNEHTRLPEKLSSNSDTRPTTEHLTPAAIDKIAALQQRKLDTIDMIRELDSSNGATESKSNTPDQDGPDTGI